MSTEWSRTMGLVLAAATLSASGLPARAADQTPPHVVLIIADDQHYGDFGFMGHPHIRTPHLDRLAAESAVFPNAYVASPLCRASLATLLTGLYPHQHRICCNDFPGGRSTTHPFVQDAPALPRLLKEAGYRSLQTGKFWEGHFANAGFTHGQTTDQDRHIATKTPQIGRSGMKPIYDFIDESKDTPFLVWYAPMMPHLPHTPPERLLQKYRVDSRPEPLARYFAMCEWLDETVGELLGYLDQKGLRDRTLVVFVVDNGWVQSETGAGGAFGGPRGKTSPYEGGIRTPVLLRWPGHTKAARYSDLVSTIDIVPTILTACGRKPTAAMRGLSLLDAAAGKGPLPRTAVFGENYLHSAKQPGKPPLDLKDLWVRQGPWKLIAHQPNGQLELYNLQDDPDEKNNLAAAQPDTAGKLQKLLDDWWKKETGQ